MKRLGVGLVGCSLLGSSNALASAGLLSLLTTSSQMTNKRSSANHFSARNSENERPSFRSRLKQALMQQSNPPPSSSMSAKGTSDPTARTLRQVLDGIATAPVSANHAWAAASMNLQVYQEPALGRPDETENIAIELKDGIYRLKTAEEHATLLRANPNKLVVMKFKASYCRACKAVESKFISVKNENKMDKLPIVWAEMLSTPENKDFFRHLGVLVLPSIQFYDGTNGLIENFPCGPKKFAILSQKLARFIETRVDTETLELKVFDEGQDAVVPDLASDEPRRVRDMFVENELVTDDHLRHLRYGMPFFRDLTDDEFSDMMSKARLLTFNTGDVIARQGTSPKMFFVIKSGQVEMCIKSRFEDPISTPTSYLGATVNRLEKFDYFGERAATTGEPFAASFRVVAKTRCFAFNVEDIPESSILSQKRRATRAFVDELSARYVLPDDYQPMYPVSERDDCILELLVRFKQIRQAAKCFEYVLSTEPLLNNQGEIARRSVLVSKLSHSQRQDFIDVFNLIDISGSGTISLLEMRRFMQSAGEDKREEELLRMINKANPSAAYNFNVGTGLTLNEFLGVMAEAEFYSLFTETFKELDRDKTGYVRAGDLDAVLGGVRDLIDGNRNSIIDVEDQDIQVDYEQFARMLLGAAL